MVSCLRRKVNNTKSIDKEEEMKMWLTMRVYIENIKKDCKNFVTTHFRRNNRTSLSIPIYKDLLINLLHKERIPVGQTIFLIFYLIIKNLHPNTISIIRVITI